MTAKIGLKDVRFHAPHGFYEEEHRMGNEFSIDVEVEASIGGAAEHDDLGDTVNYATIYYLLNAEMKKPTQLLEALAFRMASRIANQFDNVSSVTLRLRKLNPPLGGKVGSAEVEISVGAGAGGATAGGYGGIAGMPQTFEDDYDDDDYDDGPFGKGGGGGGGGGMGGIVRRPTPPPAAAAPMVFDDEAFDDEEGDFEDGDFADYDDDDALSDEELAAMMAAGGDDDGDFGGDGEEYDYEEGDYEEGDLPDFDDMDFGDLDLPDFDPDDFQ